MQNVDKHSCDLRFVVVSPISPFCSFVRINLLPFNKQEKLVQKLVSAERLKMWGGMASGTEKASFISNNYNIIKNQDNSEKKNRNKAALERNNYIFSDCLMAVVLILWWVEDYFYLLSFHLIKFKSLSKDYHYQIDAAKNIKNIEQIGNSPDCLFFIFGVVQI